MKVRWSQRCAGGCGRWLLVGARAQRAHRGCWCPPCWARHVARCSLHKTPEKVKPDAELALF